MKVPDVPCTGPEGHAEGGQTRVERGLSPPDPVAALWTEVSDPLTVITCEAQWISLSDDAAMSAELRACSRRILAMTRRIQDAFLAHAGRSRL
ncbi:MAG: hypothetical protein M3483_01465 [Gemmatimonadota bacterium]|nr:hypothetical protein [Gemmatimonadota bacterium]